jgi:protein-S-isoprenylcysteine O-methyltransferase Ste14
MGLALVALSAGIFGPRWPLALGPWPKLLGFFVAVLGLILAVAAGVALGRQLTPLPRPVADGVLLDRGAYALVRHPMYGGVLFLALAFALFTSPWALFPAAVAFPFLDLKRRREEAWLVERHPAYADYRRRVRRAFIPYLW